MKLQSCHKLFFPTPESLFLYLGDGQRQVQDLREPQRAYRRVLCFSVPLFQARDLRAREVRWQIHSRYELPDDLRYLQPLGAAPENTTPHELKTPVRLRLAHIDALPDRRSYGPFMDGLEARMTELRTLWGKSGKDT